MVKEKKITFEKLDQIIRKETAEDEIEYYKDIICNKDNEIKILEGKVIAYKELIKDLINDMKY